jgi:hypothetical protein
MGSIALDNGESVYIHDGTGSADPVAISAAEGSSVANLMKNRERFDYTWADSSERTAQTGMLQGSRGYQEDSKTEYVYDNSAWRLATPYIELTASSQSVGAGVYVAQTGWTVDSSRSTDSTFVTVSGNAFTIVKSGIYIISATSQISPIGASAWTNWTTDTPATATIAISDFVGGISTVTLPYRTSADNTILYLWAYNSSASTLAAGRVVRITRLG